MNVPATSFWKKVKWKNSDISFSNGPIQKDQRRPWSWFLDEVGEKNNDFRYRRENKTHGVLKLYRLSFFSSSGLHMYISHYFVTPYSLSCRYASRLFPGVLANQKKRTILDMISLAAPE